MSKFGPGFDAEGKRRRIQIGTPPPPPAWPPGNTHDGFYVHHTASPLWGKYVGSAGGLGTLELTEEPVTPRREDEVYEAYSPTWVEALRNFITERLANESLDGVEFTASFAASNPPTRLLRDDGRDSIGYFVRVHDGKVEVGDQPLAPSECDFSTVIDYETLVDLLFMGPAEESAFMKRFGDTLAKHGKLSVTGVPNKLSPLMDRIRVRSDFYNVYLASWLWAYRGSSSDRSGRISIRRPQA